MMDKGIIDFGKYIEDANRTFSYAKDTELFGTKHEIFSLKTLTIYDRLDELHCLIGINTEQGETMDAYKKHIFYGKPLDKVNVKEELGDIMWYIGNLCKFLDLDMQEVLDVNITKLKARYPDKFTSEAAINRDLSKERNILEGGKNE